MSALSNAAKRTFDAIGTPMVYKRTTQGEYDPVEGTAGPDVTTTYPIKASPPESFSMEYIDGTLVQRGDIQITIAAASLPFAPALASSDTSDAIELDGTTYGILHVSAGYAGPDVAIYKVQARG